MTGLLTSGNFSLHGTAHSAGSRELDLLPDRCSELDRLALYDGQEGGATGDSRSAQFAQTAKQLSSRMLIEWGTLKNKT